MFSLRLRTLCFGLPLVAACGPGGGGTTETTGTPGTTEVASTGTTGDPPAPTTGPTTAQVDTTGPGGTTGTTTSGTTGTTTAPVDDTTAGATTVSQTTGDTTASDTTTGGEACQIELPRPGECDGGEPFAPRPLPKTHPFAAHVLQDIHGKIAPPDDDDAELLETTGCSFICPPDVPGEPACDPIAQNCPEGEKCAAYADDGGSSWNNTKCVPVAEEPDGIGEPCTNNGSAVSGEDSCVKGAMCLDTGDGRGGTCVEQCSCSYENPVCTTPNTVCSISNNDSLVLCLPVCNPLDPSTCSAGDVCVNDASSGLFTCVLDASGSEGAQGDECQYINACDPGHACLSGDFVGCAGNCCSSFCAVTGSDCPQGLECLPWFPEGEAPKCFEDLGVCGSA